jgi:hypothetical protein
MLARTPTTKGQAIEWHTDVGKIFGGGACLACDCFYGYVICFLSGSADDVLSHECFNDAAILCVSKYNDDLIKLFRMEQKVVTHDDHIHDRL